MNGVIIYFKKLVLNLKVIFVCVIIKIKWWLIILYLVWYVGNLFSGWCKLRSMLFD